MKRKITHHISSNINSVEKLQKHAAPICKKGDFKKGDPYYNNRTCKNRGGKSINMGRVKEPSWEIKQIYKREIKELIRFFF